MEHPYFFESGSTDGGKAEQERKLSRIFAGEEILIDYKKALTFKPA